MSQKNLWATRIDFTSKSNLNKKIKEAPIQLASLFVYLQSFYQSIDI